MSEHEAQVRLPTRKNAIYRKYSSNLSKSEASSPEEPTSSGVDEVKPASVRQLMRLFDNGVVGVRSQEFNSKLNRFSHQKQGISRRQSFKMKEGFVSNKRNIFESTCASIDNSSIKGADVSNGLALSNRALPERSRQRVCRSRVVLKLQNKLDAGSDESGTMLHSTPDDRCTEDPDISETDATADANLKTIHKTPPQLKNVKTPPQLQNGGTQLPEYESEIYENQSNISSSFNNNQAPDCDMCICIDLKEGNYEKSQSEALEKTCKCHVEKYYNVQSNKPIIPAKPVQWKNSNSNSVQYDSATGSELSHVVDAESTVDCSDTSYDSFSDSFSSSFDDDDFEFVDEIYGNVSELNQSRPSLDLRTSSDEHQSGSDAKLQHIIKEFISTERSYVDKLHLIDQEFQQVLIMRNQQETIISKEAIDIIFSNINSIFQLHTVIFKDLERCDVPSESNPENRIGLVLRKNAPFLKLYSIYLCNFEEGQKTLELWKTKSSKFSKFIEDSESKPICGNLGLSHHMLEPVQRIPRYEMLLKEYLRYLPEDSIDRDDAQKAFELVTTAAQFSNEVMKRMADDTKLLQIVQNISYRESLLSPSRQLIKEGKMITISKRTAEHKDRYLYLFNDCLLICRSTMGINFKPHYRVTCKLSMDGLRVVKSNSVSSAFYVMGIEQVVEVCPSSQGNAEAWLAALNSAIDAFHKTTCKLDKATAPLGNAAPIWIKDHQADTCMLCCDEFNPISRRKHHCRACGIVVCGECSSHTLKLAYSEQDMRVCNTCFAKLDDRSSIVMDSSDESIMSGYLKKSSDCKTWSQYWFALQQNAMFKFESKMVKLSTAAITLDGYRMAKHLDDSEMIFCLTKSASDTHYFKADDEQDFIKWMNALRNLTNDVIPTMSDESLDSMAIEELNDKLRIGSDVADA